MKKFMKRGDTIIEVTIAISVFSLVSVISIQLMNRDIAILQGALETEMARNEIDAQAEALRYIQNAYLSERELASTKREYQNLWKKLSRGSTSAGASQVGEGLTNNAADISQFASVECRNYYQTPKPSTYHKLSADKGFVINTRKIDPINYNYTIVQSTDATRPSDTFREATLYPRIVYTSNGGSAPTTVSLNPDALSEAYPQGAADPTLAIQQTKRLYDNVRYVEGLWVISVQQQTSSSGTPEFYDFHIRTCWYAPGHNRASTIGTTIRLYNPEYIEAQR